jgi:hypothetical protein
MALRIIAVVALISGIASASIPDANGVFTGCFQKEKGSLRVIDAASQKCLTSEIAITWNEPAAASGASCDLELRVRRAVSSFEVAPACIPPDPLPPAITTFAFNRTTLTLQVAGSAAPYGTVRFYFAGTGCTLPFGGDGQFDVAVGSTGLFAQEFQVAELPLGFVTSASARVTDVFGRESACSSPFVITIQ